MRSQPVLHAFALTVAATILTGVASAQPVATSLEQLRDLVKSGDTIYVTDKLAHRIVNSTGSE